MAKGKFPIERISKEFHYTEMDEARITTPHSKILTSHVIKTAKEAGGQEFKGCVVSLCHDSYN